MTARGSAVADGGATKTSAIPIKLKSTGDFVILVSAMPAVTGPRYVARLTRATHFKVRSWVGNEKTVRRVRYHTQPEQVSRRELPQHVLQNPSILEVFELIEGIYSADQRHPL